MPAASRVASFIAPMAPFSRKSCTVACNSCFNPSRMPPPAAALPSALPSAGVSRSINGEAKDMAPLAALLAVLPTMSTASRVASLIAPTAPFSRKSFTVASHSSFSPSSKEVRRPSAGWLVPCSAAAADTSRSISVLGVSELGATKFTAPLAALPTMSTASMVASFKAPTAPFSRNSWTTSLVALWAVLAAILAVLPTISTASSVASFKAPTAPFSRNSWTVAWHSLFNMSSKDERPSSPSC
mmetsp:Transcript_118340/g.295288  ORF Transcript_118340/g.295288 Transcript_118340/m.295288 type:complete len:242 (-) Transcript_118340:499-1224(-)